MHIEYQHHVAGWRRERMPEFPTNHKFEIVPDWICEILSPSTRSIDREIYRLAAGEWLEAGHYAGNVQAAIPPFGAVPLDLGRLRAPAPKNPY